MPWGIDNNVVPQLGSKKNSGGIDGDALALFFLECIKQEGVLKLLSAAFAGFLHLFELAIAKGIGVGEKATDKSRLTVIHMANNDNVHCLPIRNVLNVCHLTCTHRGGVSPSHRYPLDLGPGRRARGPWFSQVRQ